ncbi:MAG: flagellar protein FlaG, partial [Gammaproteobacteria bacterium]|nr:flagellar protein FlaG [Gammaproteobacteria bacterium]
SFVQTVQRDLTFSFDEGSGQTVIKVIDSKSGGLVRQIPSEEVLSMATHLRDVESMMGSQQSEMPEGMLFSDKT